MSENLVITIGRQFGSGGHHIARELSKELGIKMYDNELLTLAAENSGLSKDVLKDYDERPTNSFLYSLSFGAYTYDTVTGVPQMPLVDRVFNIQSQIMKEIVANEPCIIVGRCAETVLADHGNILTVFIHGDIEQRITRIANYEKISRNAALDMIKKADKKRASYHNYFSDKKWGDATAYDLCINSRIGFDNAMQIIKYCAEKKMK